jgi:hypothetical protein
MEVKWIEQKGKKILLVDYRGAKNVDDMISILKQETEIERISTDKVSVLANFEKAYYYPKYMEELKKLGKEVRNEKTYKTALIGIVGAKKIFMQAYITFTGDKNLKTFDNEEEAKDWLLL